MKTGFVHGATFALALAGISLDPVCAWATPRAAQAEGEDARMAGLPIVPEPMVFDLVRGLHARTGEWEVNSLVVLPVKRGTPRVTWAPEVELATADGFAVELELPMENEHIEAVKLALQGTLGALIPGALGHGAQVIFERVTTDTNGVELSPLYLLGARFSREWSAFGMFGLRATLGERDANNGGGDGAGVEPRSGGVEALSNLNLFLDVSDSLVLGVESNVAWRPPRDIELLVTPQLHWKVGSVLTWQLGGGLLLDEGHVVPLAVTRLIVSTH